MSSSFLAANEQCGRRCGTNAILELARVTLREIRGARHACAWSPIRETRSAGSRTPTTNSGSKGINAWATVVARGSSRYWPDALLQIHQLQDSRLVDRRGTEDLGGQAGLDQAAGSFAVSPLARYSGFTPSLFFSRSSDFGIRSAAGPSFGDARRVLDYAAWISSLFGSSSTGERCGSQREREVLEFGLEPRDLRFVLASPRSGIQMASTCELLELRCAATEADDVV